MKKYIMLMFVLLGSVASFAQNKDNYISRKRAIGMPVTISYIDTELLAAKKDTIESFMEIDMFLHVMKIDDDVWRALSRGKIGYTKDYISFYYTVLYEDDGAPVVYNPVNLFAYRVSSGKLTLTDSKGDSYDYIVDNQ